MFLTNGWLCAHQLGRCGAGGKSWVGNFPGVSDGNGEISADFSTGLDVQPEYIG